jgi:hypothetical protein
MDDTWEFFIRQELPATTANLIRRKFSGIPPLPIHQSPSEAVLGVSLLFIPSEENLGTFCFCFARKLYLRINFKAFMRAISILWHTQKFDGT